MIRGGKLAPALRRSQGTLLVVAAGIVCAAAGAEEQSAPSSSGQEYVEVTATRIPEKAETVPVSITIITGEDLRSRGARDLRGALSLAACVQIAPGGDGGPASSVPELWGLKELDAFLLVVDGVPWGGAFNPSLATLDLLDVDRIEVVRGAAPVMYGATSFVGVIHVIRSAPGKERPQVSVSGGTYNSGSVAGSSPLPSWGKLESTVSGHTERQGFRDDRTDLSRGHLSWRGAAPFAFGSFRIDTDATWLGQEPASPHPRTGRDLSDQVPLDANHNPGGSHLQERRLSLSTGFDHKASFGEWSSLASITDSSQSALRGFLSDVSTASPNAIGIREDIRTTDAYLDTHLSFTRSSKLTGVLGIDHLHGKGAGTGGDFDYFVRLGGDNPPDAAGLPSQSANTIRDRREFSGLYGSIAWTLAERWRIEAGGRLNHTVESRSVRSLDLATGVSASGEDRRAVNQGSGAAGITWTAWRRSADSVNVYADYRSTYKPSAVDFGLDSEAEILKPETAGSYEIGIKDRLHGGAVYCELSAFQMDFDNLAVTQSTGGTPTLTNAGKQRFRGIEAQASWSIRPDLQWRTAWSLHDARFRDYVADLGGVPVQLAGNRLETSPRTLAATGLVYTPAHGWVGSLEINYVGNRYLNKRNTALAPAYATWSAGIGYRAREWEFRLDGVNLNDQRPPISESELGDAQYYRLPSIRVSLGAARSF